MEYGNFSKDGRQFLIHNVATPRPWINYIYNNAYFATISNNGGGISYLKNPLHGRITRYRINDVLNDRPGKYIYLRDNETNEYWSLTWQPVGRNLEAYRVEHGFGYSIAYSKIADISSKVTYFVPPDDNLEIWHVVLKNESKNVRELSVFGYVEFCLGHALIDLINQCDDQHFNRVYFDETLNSIFATKTYWVTENMGTQQQENKAWDQWAFFTANLPVVEYETKRERFMGLYRNENNPIAIENNQLLCKNTDFGNAIGALKLNIQLQPGETKDIIFQLGVIQKEKFSQDKNKIIKKYHVITNVAKALSEVKQNWQQKLGRVVVKTPDQNTNIFLNYWTPYQARVAFDVGRVASFYYWGISRGFGFRDTAQDIIAVTITDAQKARERICLLARQMFSNGRVYHHFYQDGMGELTKHCDDPLWFILAVTEYIKESGDLGLLDHVEPFADEKTGTILNHLMAVVRFAKHNLGQHHLPIFGRGDWNDTLDYIGGDDGGESVWGGMFYVAMLNRLVELLDFVKKSTLRSEVGSVRSKIRDSLNRYCWDGEWYLRAFGANNSKIGSHENEAGKIFLNSQSWAVIAQLDDRNRFLQAMDSVRAHLDTNFGPKICAPAFKTIDPKVGLVTRCVPGKKENGAIFCHPIPWAIQAECLLGRGNQAYAYYKKLLPNSVDSEIFQAEPYVYSQYITSDEHEHPGTASHSWQTGTAAWMYRVAIDYMLGVRAVYNGLLVDPVIPSSWREFKIERMFRGTRYVIQVHNPAGVQQGLKQIKLDGKTIDSNILPVSDKGVCHVEVVMG
jgi:cellobiose phosphorylase